MSDLWGFYDIKGAFPIRFVPDRFNLRNRRPTLARIYTIIGTLLILFKCFKRQREDFIVYSRAPKLGPLITIYQYLLPNKFFKGLFCETHSAVSRPECLRFSRGIIAISAVLKNELVRNGPGVCLDRVMVAHDGVSWTELSETDGSKKRKTLGLRTSTKIIAYTGKISSGKGVELLIEAFSKLSHRENLALLLVGKVFGEYYRNLVEDNDLSNVIFTGYVPPCEVRSFQAIADVLVVPSTRSLPYSDYTSPMKLFEYMAAKKPIIVSSLESIKEIIRHRENGLVYESSSSDDLSEAITYVLDNQAKAKSMAERAFHDVREFTWENRAKRIAHFILSKTSQDPINSARIG